MKQANDVNISENSYLFSEYILHTKFAAVVSLVEGQFLPAMEYGAIFNNMARKSQSNIIKKGIQDPDPTKA